MTSSDLVLGVVFFSEVVLVPSGLLSAFWGFSCPKVPPNALGHLACMRWQQCIRSMGRKKHEDDYHNHIPLRCRETLWQYPARRVERILLYLKGSSHSPTRHGTYFNAKGPLTPVKKSLHWSAYTSTLGFVQDAFALARVLYCTAVRCIISTFFKRAPSPNPCPSLRFVEK